VRRFEAIDFIRPAVEPSAAGCWADFGAGEGTFTEALASILGAGGRVLAVDRDAGALRALAALAERLAPPPPAAATIEVAAGDLEDLSAIAELQAAQLDGALFANSLHYLEHPERAMTSAARLLGPHGRVVVIEYERARANPWVPHPLPLARLESAAERAGLAAPVVVARRPSEYQGEMYCAVIRARAPRPPLPRDDE
jgi:ubiquinone/menaquinone biosynthesis C-methylase UbiE